MTDTWEVAGVDGMRSGYANSAELDSDAGDGGEFEPIVERVRHAQLAGSNVLHPLFGGILNAHFGGTPTRITADNVRQACGGGSGHFPGNHYGEGGERR